MKETARNRKMNNLNNIENMTTGQAYFNLNKTMVGGSTRNYSHNKNNSQYGGSTNASTTHRRNNIFGMAGNTALKNTTFA